MASPGQRKGACGHIMASFDSHSHCARCRDKGLGEDPCVSKLPCEHCELLTPEQVILLATPTYKLRKEKAKSKDTLIDPSTVTVVAQVESQDNEPAISSHNSSVEFALPQPTFRKELQELDEKWSVRMACLEAMLTIGQRPASQPSFSPVKAPVTHKPPTGVLSYNPFLLPSVPSGQARIELIRLLLLHLPLWTWFLHWRICTRILTRTGFCSTCFFRPGVFSRTVC